MSPEKRASERREGGRRVIYIGRVTGGALRPTKASSPSFLSHLNIFINILPATHPPHRADRMHYSTSCHHLIDLGT